MHKRDLPAVTVTKRCYERCQTGDVRVYDNEIISADTAADGSIVDVVSEKGRYIGSGFYNSASKIRVRIISDNANDRFDDAFFLRRLEYSWQYRRTVMGNDISCCRIIFGEADGFPGLTVDRFNDLLSVQILSLGIEQRRDVILNGLVSLLERDGAKVNGIYLRNDSDVRVLEGMKEEKGWYLRRGETSPETVITENGIMYYVDVENGQKTGFFLDQKYNRQAAARLAKGRTVLDCCTHTGSFGLNCAAAGAARVTCVDVSASAIEMTRRNAALNDIDIETEKADVFDFLRRRIDAHDRSADLIILDPPAFTKSSKTVGNAKNGYTELNALGMRLLPRGGYLATASCSHFMTPPLFTAMLEDAARSVGVKLRCVERRGASPDHPVLSGVPQTEYLKFHIYQVI